MSIIVNNTVYIIKSTIIGALYPNIMKILLPPVKEEDGLTLIQWL